MSVETFEISEIINVTPTAAAHFAKQIEKSGRGGIRISLAESGCTGFKYVIEDVEEPEVGDVIITLENAVKVFIEAANIGAIRGTEVDYTQQGVNKTLVMNNPNVKASCGCGESFSV